MPLFISMHDFLDWCWFEESKCVHLKIEIDSFWINSNLNEIKWRTNTENHLKKRWLQHTLTNNKIITRRRAFCVRVNNNNRVWMRYYIGMSTVFSARLKERVLVYLYYLVALQILLKISPLNESNLYIYSVYCVFLCTM